MNFMGMSISFNHETRHSPLVARLLRSIFIVMLIAGFLIVMFGLLDVAFYVVSVLVHLCLGLPVPPLHDLQIELPSAP